MNSEQLFSLIEPAALAQRPFRLIFVCTGNICRSPMAHGMFDHLAGARMLGSLFQTESAGLTSYHVGDNVDGRMRQLARRQGVELNHYACHFSQADLDYFDLILAMDGGHFRQLQRMAEDPEQQAKILMYRDFDPASDTGLMQDVPDPYYGTMADFQLVFDMTRRCSLSMLDHFLAVMKKFQPRG